ANNPVAPTLMDLLTMRAEQQADFRVYTFLEDAEGEETYLTHAELDAKARRIAASLAPQAVGERVMLLYPPGTEYIAGFFGCLYAGAVAVPAYPPDPMRLERTLPRLRSIIEDAQATVVLTNSFILSMAEFVFEQAPELRKLKWVATDELPAGLETQWKRPDVTPGSLAFLQYTSGSTGSPKGVLLSNSNLLENLRVITHSFDTRLDDQGIIWLPPYHDMGLIGGILQPLYANFPVALMSPLSFLRRPYRWMQAVTRFGGSVSGGPNFAYDLCVRKTTPEERSTLDLSRWRLAFNGAEPIRPETLERFVEAFGPYGFRRESFYPCYGLAEATLFVTGGVLNQPPVLSVMQAEGLEQNRAVAASPDEEGARVLVGSGRIGPDHELIVVDPVTRERRAPGQVGELWVAGRSVAGGYWGKRELTEATFQARPADGIGGPYLRTGDLGFLQADGELFVTGRQKDLIIIRGRNHYPQDLELSAERSHPAVRPGCNVAFSEEGEDGERLVVVVEVSPREGLDTDAVVAAVRGAVEQEHELRVDTVVLARPGSVPKTSSGKLQRRACRQMLREGSLEVVAQSSLSTAAPTPEETAPEAIPDVATLRTLPPAERRQALVTLVRQELARALRLPLSAVEPSCPVSNLGLDSLAAVELG
ncbi:MAG TPA: AMP-binding protein, partial [Archangium sp.]|nr:AMP-binding protein [Archangium sp.]